MILTHSLSGEVRGLKDLPADRRTPVAVVFFAFRIMAGIGLVVLAVVALGGSLLWHGRLLQSHWFLRLCHWTAPLGFVAMLACAGRPRRYDCRARRRRQRGSVFVQLGIMPASD